MNTMQKRSMIAFAAMMAIGTAAAQTTTTPQPAQASPQPQLQKGMTGEPRSGTWSLETFSRLDLNKDGMISKDEAQADPTIRDAWSKLDAKNAGKVTLADFDTYGRSQAQSHQAPAIKPKS